MIPTLLCMLNVMILFLFRFFPLSYDEVDEPEALSFVNDADNTFD